MTSKLEGTPWVGTCQSPMRMGKLALSFEIGLCRNENLQSDLNFELEMGSVLWGNSNHGLEIWSWSQNETFPLQQPQNLVLSQNETLQPERNCSTPSGEHQNFYSVG